MYNIKTLNKSNAWHVVAIYTIVVQRALLKTETENKSDALT